MRGEYKTPGGKLVVVEFSVHDGAIHDVAVTGDFFLYPEEALPLLAQSIEGAPVFSTASAIAERVQAVLDEDVSLVGSSAEGIAIAVARALEDMDAENDVTH